eukprot:309684-Amphidinium_carterae.1
MPTRPSPSLACNSRGAQPRCLKQNIRRKKPTDLVHAQACSMAADGELPLHRFIASGANCLPVLLQLVRTYPIAASVQSPQWQTSAKNSHCHPNRPKSPRKQTTGHMI